MIDPAMLPSPILIVEDDIDVAYGLSSVLELDGVRVHVAHSGAEAIASVSALRPAAMILDMRLPDMTGLDLYGVLSDLIEPVPVVFSTGLGDPSVIEDLINRGLLVRLLQKPYTIDALVEALVDLARESQ